MELSRDGLSVKPGAKKRLLSATNTEAAYMHRRGRYYYLFASAGSCCEGVRSSYHVIVGRSTSPLGPFKGPDGQKFNDTDYGYTVVKGTEDRKFAGPGHNAEIITDDAGQDWMLYHCYNAANGYKGRLLHLDKVLWTVDGWPYFESGHPCEISPAPVFTR